MEYNERKWSRPIQPKRATTEHFLLGSHPQGERELTAGRPDDRGFLFGNARFSRSESCSG